MKYQGIYTENPTYSLVSISSVVLEAFGFPNNMHVCTWEFPKIRGRSSYKGTHKNRLPRIHRNSEVMIVEV